jgi:hypothetical protein
MNEKYDCTIDVRNHKSLVEQWICHFLEMLDSRARNHDNSKLNDPTEKELFDYWTPELRKRTFGTDEYKQALDSMDEGIKLHYYHNAHHPEHHPNGVNDMTLVDIFEMFCDWIAAAQRNNATVDLDKAKERFGLSDQLVSIFANTLRAEDVWNEASGDKFTVICPDNYKNGYVDGFEEIKYEPPK